MSFFDSLRDGLDKVWAGISKSISILVSGFFLIFTVGAFFGYVMAQLPGDHRWVLMLPPLFGVIAFFYRTTAIILFILFLIFVFLL